MPDAMRGPSDCCEPVGCLEYVVESRQDNRLETSARRLVVDAQSLKARGVLAPVLPAMPMAAGYNPYFDLPAA